MLRRSVVTGSHALIVAAACIALIVGCASSNKSAAGTTAPERDVTILDSAEMAGHGYPTTYVAIQSARPAWLRVPIGPPAQRDNGGGSARFPTSAQVARAGGDGANAIGVFLEGSTQPQGIGYLTSTPVEQIARLRHLSASEAMSTYGPQWAWGAIVIRLRQ